MNHFDNLPPVIAPTRTLCGNRNASFDEYSNVILDCYRRYVSDGLKDPRFNNRFAKSLLFLGPFISANIEPGNLNALEIGSGNGAKALGIAHLFKSYTGFDISEKNVGRAKKIQVQLKGQCP